ncbi:flavin-containing monooxygenase [Microbacterium resistens]|uniref:flavin-containing monooxygenase n=1 Tax=Microbacterium resistens TaxID=156977 RepID=UPI0008299DE1|nr:NAD(P)/FAD-dependent oxidoreductase [Microbacterium resistens]
MTTTTDRRSLRHHLAGVNPAVLLATLVSVTGDMGRAEPLLAKLTYEPTRGGVLSRLPAAAEQELHAWAEESLTDPPDVDFAQGRRLDDDTFARLAGALVGWTVEAESSPFLKEQAGFATFVPTVPRTRSAPSGFRLAIIGAGMAGIAMAIAAKQAGIDAVVLEKQSSLGGVWNLNTYPGVGVDTPSRYYSFSFEVNRDWTHPYPDGVQFRDYLERVARTYGILDDIRFDTEVTDLRWDDDRGEWTISGTRNGSSTVISANAVVTAAGYLTRFRLPDVPGIDSFEGEWFHSADWDHGADLRGKRLAVVGTGCTSVQIVDALADEVSSLTLFQRQPHWVMSPAGREGYTPSELWRQRHLPTYATWARLHTFLPIGDAIYPVVRYDEAWATTHDRSISEANDRFLQLYLDYLDTSFADRPDLKAKLTPGFAPFGKRPVRDPGRYYSTLKKETSTLVTSGLRAVVPTGIVDGDGELHEVDVIVYATGFDLTYLSDWTITGREGQTLREVWGDSPLAYNGCQVPGFPNLFITSGPHSNPSHGGGQNFGVETVVHYVIESLQMLFENDARSIDVRRDAWERWGTEIREVLADSVWARETRATTYYRNAKGEVILANPFTMEDFWRRLREPAPEDVVLS